MAITYANGSVPASLLAPLAGQPDASLRADAAAAWNRARADVKRRTGIVLDVRGWNRTLAEQERFFFERYEPRKTGGTDIRWYKNVRYARVRGAAAAIPGTSNHGLGIAIDVDDYGLVGQFDYPRRTKTIPILAEHGWTDNEGRGAIREPWHLVYDPSKDKHAGATPAPATTQRKVDDPMIYRAAKERTPYGVYAHNGGWAELYTKAEYDNLKNAGVPEVWVERQTLDWLIKDSRGDR